MENLQFPLVFSKCPTCGSERRIANEVLEEEKGKGRAEQEASAFLFQQRSVIADPSRTILIAPMIVSILDACADCGALYCIRAEKVTVERGSEQKGQRYGRGYKVN